MNRFSFLSLAMAASGLTACLDATEQLSPVAVPATTASPAEPVCDAVITGVSPEGVLPASRTAPIALELVGHADRDSVKVQLSGPDGVVPGELTLTEGLLELRPDAPLAPGNWLLQASVCDSHVTRLFDVGEVHHPMSDGDWRALEGKQLGFDLRYGTWMEPAARDGRELILRNLFASALVLDILETSAAGGVVAVAPGTLQADGSVGVSSAPGRAAALHFANPYGMASLPELRLQAQGRALTLREGALVLGFSDEGVVDGRLSAEADLRDFGPVDGSPVCEILELHTLASCVPCVSDGSPTCFSLTLEGLSSHD